MLTVSDNRRFLVHGDGTPYFYLGDTAWELFHRLTREEAEFYLRNRAAKRFTVIQAVVLAEFDGLTEPNRYGALPLIKHGTCHLEQFILLLWIKETECLHPDRDPRERCERPWRP
jgi:Protein of unknown function (DUF4038)